MSKRGWLMSAAAAVLFGAVSSAYAASVTIDFTASAAGGDYGADNSLSLSSGGVTVTAKAWTMAAISSSSRTQVFLGKFSAGLGVSNDSETSSQTSDTGNNEHTVDNLNGFDFVQMTFDKQVKITSVTVRPFGIWDGSATE